MGIESTIEFIENSKFTKEEKVQILKINLDDCNLEMLRLTQKIIAIKESMERVNKNDN